MEFKMSDSSSIHVDIKKITKASVSDLKLLYKEAGWWDVSFEEDPEFLNHITKKSACFVGAFLNKKLIGMGRALSDLTSDAYIQDVTVLKAYRGKKIGKKIIKELVTQLKGKGVDWIGLVAEPGTTSFYKPLGFKPLKDHVALKYEG